MHKKACVGLQEHKIETIKDRFGVELKVGDFVISGGEKSGFDEYFIRGISKSHYSEGSIMRIYLNEELKDLYKKITRQQLYKSLFVGIDFDFIIIDPKYLSENGKNSLNNLKTNKWFIDDYM